jgi:hypothetical protein
MKLRLTTVSATTRWVAEFDSREQWKNWCHSMDMADGWVHAGRYRKERYVLEKDGRTRTHVLEWI